MKKIMLMIIMKNKNISDLQGKPIDIWALEVTLYILCYKKFPFDSEKTIFLSCMKKYIIANKIF